MDYLRDLLQEDRVKYAIDVLSKLGFIVERINNSTLKFEYKGSIVLLYPYTGWFTGKTINDGRGIKNLIKQLTKEAL
jgi:hypothetical protein